MTCASSTWTEHLLRAAVIAAVVMVAGCAGQPVVERGLGLPAGIADARGRFGEVFCAVIERDGPAAADPDLTCRTALREPQVGPSQSKAPVELPPSSRHLVLGLVSGIGYACVAAWLQADDSTAAQLRASGYDLQPIEVGALASSEANARRIRDQIMSGPDVTPARLVLIGYSKGAPDVLEAVIRYPEIRERVAAVVSLAGAVGGSPLAEDSGESVAGLLRFFPGAECDDEETGAVASLRPSVRGAWLEANPLPDDLPYYSVVTWPEPERVSRALLPTYRRLARVDERNDGQLLAVDQFVPGSTLLALINADHWAAALPIAEAHPSIARLLVTHNAFPRAALLEAILRVVEQDLAAQP